MPLKLIPPGERGNKVWYIRGSINGERVEVSTGTTDKIKANKRKKELEDELDRTDGSENVTFAYAAEQYKAFRSPCKLDKTRIDRLVVFLGKKMVREINQSDLVRAANSIMAGRLRTTKNRAVIRPAAAILHYAAKNKWCDWLRVEKFKEPEAKTRFVTDAHEDWLLEAVKDEEDKYMLILWLFRQGDRISDVLGIKYEDCDLKKNIVKRYISKNDTTTILPLDDEIGDLLRARQNDGQKTGPIFPWKTRWGVEKWIRLLCDRLEIHFTPHMARHTVGKRLSESGASLRLIMDKLGHKDSKSSLRYQRGDIEGIREASKYAKTGGRTGGKA